ncbi:MAG TPA: zinc-ribbon domain-containing protein [Candidatus Limnocylindrales bacterium]|nr:zinc-ribbon domain-containing protein [Candidatus Limnocylindrales bacterium]
MAFCSKCGAQLNEGASFCPGCGTPVAPGVTGAAPQRTSAGMQRNVAGLLCYILGIITGIIFLLIEPYKRDPFVRFHAFQSIFLWVAWAFIFLVLGVILPFGFYWSVYWPLRLVAVACFIFAMYKAYNNEEYRFPWVGDLAAKQAGLA